MQGIDGIAQGTRARAEVILMGPLPAWQAEAYLGSMRRRDAILSQGSIPFFAHHLQHQCLP
jgi:hypothetical protein